VTSRTSAPRAGSVVRRLAKDPAFRGKLALDAVLWDDPEARAVMLATQSPQASVNDLETPSRCEVVITILWTLWRST
jgi:hypothetical protein